MIEPGGISRELRPYVDRGEAEPIDRIGQRLQNERPVPGAGFRATLGARLALAPTSWRPRRLRLTVAAYLASGLLLLALAALGLADAGPLAY
jgi:hypothetical protein